MITQAGIGRGDRHDGGRYRAAEALTRVAQRLPNFVTAHRSGDRAIGSAACRPLF